ncbi:large subunit ribosomal protein L13e [Nematocida homosporus]|uniref:large subunit ribosomal protein L13e n=1 Tax=Nematocida homosporus TaxID=1912981 RepID=UPI0022205775|nr:large subunit ribosomal protein L13e [Nematocida homosporus]KAI5184271.1 large subunit ribosomal protein L13e [Nematocida homosporus]
MKHNHALSTGHFRKTSLRYKTWFKQPIQKRIRRERRLEKAKKIAPMNVEQLRPVVRCNSRRYNIKERLGRGFSFAEVSAAGLTATQARELGIAVDGRRYSYSEEGVARNVARIKEYLSKTTVFASMKEARESGMEQHRGVIMPAVRAKPVIEFVPRSEVVAEATACATMNALRNECISRRASKEKSGLLREFPMTKK